MKSYKPMDINYWDIENSFYLKATNDRIGKLLSHYEIYKEILTLPGDILELGVFKGASLVRWATFRNLLECQDSRSIYGFDSFGLFPVENISISQDLDFAKEHDDDAGVGIDEDELMKAFKLKGIENVSLIKGDIFDSLPDFLEEHAHLKISLLHIDIDVYEPTKFALEQLWDRIVPDGVLVVDDYNAVEGATRATDDFFSKKCFSNSYKAKFYRVPTVFIK